MEKDGEEKWDSQKTECMENEKSFLREIFFKELSFAEILKIVETNLKDRPTNLKNCQTTH